MSNSKTSSTIRQFKLKDIAHFSKTRIDAKLCSTYVSVETLLPDKQGLAENLSTPSENNVIRFNKGDILIGNIRPYLKKIWLADRDGGTNGDVLVIQNSVPDMLCSRYLYYILSSDSFFHYSVQTSKGSKMPRGDKNSIMDYPVSIPSVEIQNEIVRILDSFTALTARRLQYEFYRDKLLSFDDLNPEKRERGEVDATN